MAQFARQVNRLTGIIRLACLKQTSLLQSSCKAVFDHIETQVW